MFRFLILSTITIFALCLLSTIGCSGGTSDSASIVANPIVDTSPKTAQSERMLWGIWQFTYDEISGTLTPVPMREAYAHFNTTPMLLPPNCTDCLKTKVNSFDSGTHILDVDVTFRNPTLITGHDVRGILYTNTSGHELLNADDWTGLFDIPGGDTINPFKAFAKSVTKRTFAPAYEATENYLIHIPTPPGWNKITYAVDAAWPGNCKEPYSIENFVQETLYDTGGAQALVTVDALDWQNDVDNVTFTCEPITGIDPIVLSNISSNTWGGFITNNAGALAGDYQAKLTATSANSGILALSDYVTITVTQMAEAAGFAYTWGGDYNDYGYAVATDTSDNIYVTGLFNGTADLDPGTGVDSHIAVGGQDAYLSKFDSNGAFQWARTWGGDDDEYGKGVATDSTGNIYISGVFFGTADFDPGPGEDLHTAAGQDEVFLSKFDSDGNFQWARTWGGVDDDYGYGVATDTTGNIYIGGRFFGIVDFNPGVGEDLHDSGVQDFAFLSKFDSGGNFQWARTWGGSSYDYGYGVATDNSNNVYITGRFWGTHDFDPSGGEDTHAAGGPTDAFLSKFDSNGTFQWARSWGGTDADESYAVATDGSDNVYVTGLFSSLTDLDPAAGEDLHDSNGPSDAFLSKFDPNGAFQWARTWGGGSYDYGYGVATDSLGNISVTGFFSGTGDFDPGPGVDSHTSNGFEDAFASNFDSSGSFQWARTWGSTTDYDRGNGVATDSSGDVYVTGIYRGTADFDPGIGEDWHTCAADSDDVFLIKFLPDGNW